MSDQSVRWCLIFGAGILRWLNSPASSLELDKGHFMAHGSRERLCTCMPNGLHICCDEPRLFANTSTGKVTFACQFARPRLYAGHQASLYTASLNTRVQCVSLITCRRTTYGTLTEKLVVRPSLRHCTCLKIVRLSITQAAATHSHSPLRNQEPHDSERPPRASNIVKNSRAKTHIETVQHVFEDSLCEESLSDVTWPVDVSRGRRLANAGWFQFLGDLGTATLVTYAHGRLEAQGSLKTPIV